MGHKIFLLIICCFVCTMTKAQGKFGGGDGDGYAMQSFSASVVSIEREDPIKVWVYPNPARDIVYIRHNKLENSELILSDSQGRELIKLKKAPSEIRINHLSPGIYYLRVGRVVRKIVKE